jgi:hypothetical protein
MKRIFLRLVLMSTFIIGLMAVDLPWDVNGKQNVSSVYAWGRRPGTGGGSSASEPSLLILLGGGIAGIAAYRYMRNNKKK